MTVAVKDFLKKTKDMSPMDRAELIEGLFRSFDATPHKDVDAAWAHEAESRIDAIDRGDLKMVDAEAVFKSVNDRR